MKTMDLVTTALSNTFRSKTRTVLTILAIFVGAFTLTLTNGLGTGINAYIDDTVGAVGGSDTMTVTKADGGQTAFGTPGSGPAEYNPDSISAGLSPGPLPDRRSSRSPRTTSARSAGSTASSTCRPRRRSQPTTSRPAQARST
ncbi:MAG TPA: ABC transporter permease [Plantibacter sp.]|uniref:ABC transporter permease n=1 Tax=unclassified Plantibacter TaxID=2624265 RepID=UPI002B6ADF94|nr:ABC transporter permease [Plantibacter sp.]